MLEKPAGKENIMKRKNFNNHSTCTQFAEKLFVACKGTLSRKEIYNVTNKLSCDIIQELMESVQKRITIIRDSNYAAKKFCLISSEWLNIDFDYEKDVCTGNCLLGNVTLGSDYSYKEFYNGNQSSQSKSKTVPVFDAEQPAVVLVDRHMVHQDEGNSTDAEYDYHLYYLLIYAPAKSRKKAC